VIARALTWCAGSVVAYTYLGYPLALTVAGGRRAALRPARSAPTDGELPHISLVIAAFNEEASIHAKLENTFSSDYPGDRVEVIVVADGSDDGTVDRACAFGDPRVRVLHIPERRGKVAAVNRAVEVATGEIVVFSDANNRYASGTLRALVEPFGDPSVGAVSGAKHVDGGVPGLRESEGLYWRYEAFIREAESRLGCCTAASGEVLAVRREHAGALPDDAVLDDFARVLAVLRQGADVVFAPEARSYEATAATAGDEVVRRRKLSAGRWRLVARSRRWLPWHRPVVLWQVVSHKVLRLVLPFAMAVTLVANLVAVRDPGVRSGERTALRSLLGLQVAFYAAAAFAPTGPRGRVARSLHVPRFVVTSNWAAVEGLWQVLHDPDPQLWPRVARFPEPTPGPQPTP
jgi:biofilm PGA synthesis N-glycosyltransferase PgaC